MTYESGGAFRMALDACVRKSLSDARTAGPAASPEMRPPQLSALAEELHELLSPGWNLCETSIPAVER